METAFVETSPLKDGRRVLGEKTANASLTPAKNRIDDLHKPPTTTVPVKVSHEPPNPRRISPPPCHAGQKRTLDQIEEDTSTSEPRKVLMTAQPESGEKFRIFEESKLLASRAEMSRPRLTNTTLPSSQQHGDDVSQERPVMSSERVSAGSASRVPTDPEARRVFIQEKAALARTTIQTAMRRVEDRSLDRALSEFEANGRSLFGPISSYGRGSPSTSRAIGSASQSSSAQTQSRTLLPPLPLQPGSRPVRSTGQTTISSPSASLDTGSVARADEEMETPRPPHVVRKKKKCRNEVDRMIAETPLHGDVGVDGLVKLMETSTEYDGLDTWTG